MATEILTEVKPYGQQAAISFCLESSAWALGGVVLGETIKYAAHGEPLTGNEIAICAAAAVVSSIPLFLDLWEPKKPHHDSRWDLIENNNPAEQVLFKLSEK